MDVNNFFQQAEAVSGYRPHPNGDFQGTITAVNQRSTQQGQTLWDLSISTAAGTATKSIFDITQGDLAKAKNDQTAMDRLVRSAGSCKRMLIDLGVIAEAQAGTLKWNTGGPDSFIGLLGSCIGKPCRVVVESRQGPEPWKQNCYINAHTGAADQDNGMPPRKPKDGAHGGQMAAPPPTNGGGWQPQPPPQQQQYAATPPQQHQMQPPPQAQPGFNAGGYQQPPQQNQQPQQPDLDNIPF